MCNATNLLHCTLIGQLRLQPHDFFGILRLHKPLGEIERRRDVILGKADGLAPKLAGIRLHRLRRLLDRANLPQWVEVWDAIGRAKADAASLNLDRSLLVLEAFYRLQQVARENPV